MATKNKTTYRVEYMSTGGDWGHFLVPASTPQEAEAMVAMVEGVDLNQRPKTTHRIDPTTHEPVRIAL